MKNRIEHIKETRKDAVDNGACKEEYYQIGENVELTESGCKYPHCICLYGENGPINPKTGKEMKR